MTSSAEAVASDRERGASWVALHTVPAFASVLTLVLVAVFTEGALRLWILPLVALGALWPRSREHPLLWIAIAAVRIIGQIPSAWYEIDNHQYLLTYWCLALAVAFIGPHVGQTLRSNARLLVGFAFAFATLWKLISPDFLDGSLFHFVLVAEEGASTLFGPLLGIQPVPEHGLDEVAAMGLGYTAPGPIPLAYGGTVGPWPQTLAISTVVLEGAIAAAYLAPLRSRLWIRGVLLLVFLWVTYPVIPVIGFGMVLAALGHAGASGPRERWCFLVTFAALPVMAAITAVTRIPPGFELTLAGVVLLVVYLAWNARSLLIVGCVVLGGSLGVTMAGGGMNAGAVLIGAGSGLLAVVVVDLAARRRTVPALPAVGAAAVLVGLVLLLL